MRTTTTLMTALAVLGLAAVGFAADGKFGTGTTLYSGANNLSPFTPGNIAEQVQFGPGGPAAWDYTSTVVSGWRSATELVPAPSDTSFRNDDLGPMGSTVNLLLSTTATGTPVVKWRGRAASETVGGGTKPPLPPEWSHVSSDVALVNGISGAYVVQMDVAPWQLTQEEIIGDFEKGILFPARLGTNALGQYQWELATNGNSARGALATAKYPGSWSSFAQAYCPDGDLTDVLGSWGMEYSPASGGRARLWAVVDGDGQYAVPEPGTIGLLLTGGLMGLVFGRKRLAKLIAR
jgi:hypothetical protein